MWVSAGCVVVAAGFFQTTALCEFSHATKPKSLQSAQEEGVTRGCRRRTATRPRGGRDEPIQYSFLLADGSENTSRRQNENLAHSKCHLEIIRHVSITEKQADGAKVVIYQVSDQRVVCK